MIATLLSVAAMQSAVSQFQNPKPALHGSLRADAGYLWQGSDVFGSRPPFTYSITADPRFSYGRWQITSLLQWGSFEDRANQAFNRFGISPQRGWFTLHLGHRNYRYSNFTVNGRTVWGAGFEMKPGMFRLAAVAGNFQRETTSNFQESLDEVTAFRRPGYAVKIGAGTDINFVDLIFFRAHDDTSNTALEADHFAPGPKENVVMGARTEQRIAKHFFLVADAAVSAINQNTLSDTLHVEEFLLRDDVLGIFHPRYSAQYSGALHGEVEYRNRETAIGISYDLVQPDYQSLGALAIQNDRERYGMKARWTMFRKTLFIFTDASSEKNNLLGMRMATTVKRTANVGATLRASQRTNANFNYNLYIIEQNTADSSLLSGTMHNAQASVYAQLKRDRRISGSTLLSLRHNNTTGLNDYASLTARIAYEFPLEKNNTLAPEIGAGVFRFSSGINSLRVMPGVRFNKMSSDRQATFNAGLLNTTTLANNKILSSIITANAGVIWSPATKHSFNFRFGYSLNLRSTAYQELRGDAGYVFRF